jgi:hypothetical protein
LSTIPFDNLPAPEIRNALSLLSLIRAGVAPRRYIIDTPSANVLDHLINAGLVRVCEGR